MFVLVVDTSIMNVSISAVVADLGTDVSAIQSAIALEALVSAAFILIGSKIGDLFGRKRAYILGLLAYAVGALAMALSQSVAADLHLLGGHRRPRRVAPAARDAVAHPRQLRGGGPEGDLRPGRRRGGDRGGRRTADRRLHHDLPVVPRRVPARGRRHRDRAGGQPAGQATCRTPGRAQIDLVGAVLSVLGMGGLVLGILVWQEGGEAVGLLLAIGVVSLAAFAWWLVRRKREGKPTLIDPDLFKSMLFRFGISGQLLQNVALGGAMITIPIYLQMVLEYNALQAGLSLAPLSLSMFATAIVAGRRSGNRRPSQHHPGGVRAPAGRPARPDPDHPAGRRRLVPGDPAGDRRDRPGAAGLPAQQLHAVADRRGAGQRGGRRQLGRRLVRAVVRPGVRRRDHAGDARLQLHEPGRAEHGAHPGPAAGGRRRRSSTTPRS